MVHKENLVEVPLGLSVHSMHCKGRFGDTKRREGRIQGLNPKPGPMDRFVVRDLPANEASEEATYTKDRSRQRRKGWVGENQDVTHKDGNRKQ